MNAVINDFSEPDSKKITLSFFDERGADIRRFVLDQHEGLLTSQESFAGEGKTTEFKLDFSEVIKFERLITYLRYFSDFVSEEEEKVK